MNYYTKINLLKALDETKESCWRGEVVGVVGIITYQDGSYSELMIGEIDLEMMYVKVHQIAHQLLEKFLVRKEEI
tara:strand:+ start:356 stop:580 length:225 start_codon:yes stop_codon:yes gene_type:complete